MGFEFWQSLVKPWYDSVCTYNFPFLPESDVKLSTENYSFFAQRNV